MAVSQRLTMVMVADVPVNGVNAFEEYESRVLPLLQRHEGCLERRLRSADSLVEVHIVSFGSRDGYESYLADPERMQYRQLLDGVDVGQRLVEVRDV